MLQTFAIPAFADNYLWVLHNGSQAVVVDPGDANAVINALDTRKLTLSAVLITHHHPDHVAGLQGLLERWPVPVHASLDSTVPGVTRRHAEGEFLLEGLDRPVQTLSTPGHTLDHLCFYLAEPVHNEDRDMSGPALFCGDTLFIGGCGRLFEGTAEQMRTSLQKLAALPPDTLVHCAHEYTRSNLAFARAALPMSETFAHYLGQIETLRKAGKTTVPGRLAMETAHNPFLNDDNPAVRVRLEEAGFATAGTTFAGLRLWKDGFRAC